MSEEGSTSSGPQRGARYDLLLDEAVPELVRVNAFRLTQLPVSASQREISKQVEKINMAEKLGVSSGVSAGVLPVPGGVDAEGLRAAIQRLRDPEKHLIDELFWFWPLENGGSNDAGLAALRSGDLRGAALSWMNAQENGGRRGAVALHNLAVLALVGVIDSEFEEREGSLAQERREVLSRLWKATYQRWIQLRKTPVFWTALASRVDEIDDPRLGEDVVWNLRKTLPEALSCMASRLAVSLWEAEKCDASRRVFTALHDSDLPPSDVKRGIRTALEPVRTRIKASIDTAEKSVRQDESGNRPLDAAKRMLEQSEPLLQLVDVALPKGDATRTGLHDDLALAVLRFAVKWGNRTEDNKGVEPWMARARKIAEGEAASERIAENERIVQKNIDAEAPYASAMSNGTPSYSAPPMTRSSGGGGCLTCGVIVIIIFLIIIIGSVASNGCDGSDSASTGSLPPYSESSYDESYDDSEESQPSDTGKPDAGYVEKAALYDLFKRVWKARDATPETLNKPDPNEARRLRRLARQIRQWGRRYDASSDTKRIVREGAAFAQAAGAWFADPDNDAKYDAYDRTFRPFNEDWETWSP